MSFNLRVSCESGDEFCILTTFSLATARGPKGFSGESIAPGDIEVLGCGEVSLYVELCSAKSWTTANFVATFAAGSSRVLCGTADDEGS